MGVGTYVAYSGAVSNQQRLEIIANNLANAATAGFRRDTTVFSTELGARLQHANVEASTVDLTPGSQQMTGNPLHAAIDGDGLFAVQGEDGQEYYTRRGDFRLDARNQLVLPNGMPVLGAGGAIVVPPGVEAGFTTSGALRAGDRTLGQLRIVEIAAADLQKRGDSLLGIRPGAEAKDAPYPRVAPGHSEASNVNVAGEMVALIEASRTFEASMRSLRIHDELTSRLISSQR